MMHITMPRRKVTYRWDDRVIDAAKEAATEANSSVSNWLETELFRLLKERGLIPADAKPLGETRGGDRTSGDDGDG